MDRFGIFAQRGKVVVDGARPLLGLHRLHLEAGLFIPALAGPERLASGWTRNHAVLVEDRMRVDGGDGADGGAVADAGEGGGVAVGDDAFEGLMGHGVLGAEQVLGSHGGLLSDTVSGGERSVGWNIASGSGGGVRCSAPPGGRGGDSTRGSGSEVMVDR